MEPMRLVSLWDPVTSPDPLLCSSIHCPGNFVFLYNRVKSHCVPMRPSHYLPVGGHQGWSCFLAVPNTAAIHETSVCCLKCALPLPWKHSLNLRVFSRVSYVWRIMLSALETTWLLHSYFDFFLLSYFALAKILSKIKMGNYWLHLIKTLSVNG